MRVLTATPLGRLQLAVAAFTIALLTLNIFVLNRIDDPSLGTSLLNNTPFPLLVCTIALGFKARGEFIPRDRLALALGMITAGRRGPRRRRRPASRLLRHARAVRAPAPRPDDPRADLVRARPQADR
jgi:hypothetical protein